MNYIPQSLSTVAKVTATGLTLYYLSRRAGLWGKQLVVLRDKDDNEGTIIYHDIVKHFTFGVIDFYEYVVSTNKTDVIEYYDMLKKHETDTSKLTEDEKQQYNTETNSWNNIHAGQWYRAGTTPDESFVTGGFISSVKPLEIRHYDKNGKIWV